MTYDSENLALLKDQSDEVKQQYTEEADAAYERLTNLGFDANDGFGSQVVEKLKAGDLVGAREDIAFVSGQQEALLRASIRESEISKIMGRPARQKPTSENLSNLGQADMAYSSGQIDFDTYDKARRKFGN